MRTDYRSQAPVALTFDDGPDPVWIPLVWESLANARATFLVASEILYYFTREEMLATLRACEREPHREEFCSPQGDEMHGLFMEHTRLRNGNTIYEQEYRLDLFEDPA